VDFGDVRAGFDAGARVVAPFARARGIRRIDEAVITHEDQDHAGGWDALARDVRVGELASGGEALEALGARARAAPGRPRLRAVAAGDTLLAGPGYVARVLWPPPGVTGWPANERCVVIEVEAGGDCLYLTGDADSTTETRWLAAASGPAAALKLAHHGARACTGCALLAALRPRLALVSCGRDNRFGHPHAETLARLGQRGIPIRRTDRDGTVRLDLGRLGPAAPARAGRLTPGS
jgi:competence protein ComEC